MEHTRRLLAAAAPGADKVRRSFWCLGDRPEGPRVINHPQGTQAPSENGKAVRELHINQLLLLLLKQKVDHLNSLISISFWTVTLTSLA